MIVLAVLLWIQAVVLAIVMGASLYVAGKEPGYSAAVAWITGILFGGTGILSAVAAIAVGGLA